MTSDQAATFEPHRRRLRGLAHRMLGSIAEAEDAVQAAYQRWHQVDFACVADPRAFLTTTTTRICLDVLKSARSVREADVGPWLPDPVLDDHALAPDAQTELADDLSVALLLVLERLLALERAAFLLHDVFDYSFAEVAAALGAHASDPQHAALIQAFVGAARTGDLEALTRMLASETRLVPDGGGKVAAAMNVISGAGRVAAFPAGVVRKGWMDDLAVREATINGLPGLLLCRPDGLVQTTAFEVCDGVVTAINIVRNPDKLRHLA